MLNISRNDRPDIYLAVGPTVLVLSNVQSPGVETETDSPPLWVALDWQSDRLLGHVTCTEKERELESECDICKNFDTNKNLNIFV